MTKKNTLKKNIGKILLGSLLLSIIFISLINFSYLFAIGTKESYLTFDNYYNQESDKYVSSFHIGDKSFGISEVSIDCGYSTLSGSDSLARISNECLTHKITFDNKDYSFNNHETVVLNKYISVRVDTSGSLAVDRDGKLDLDPNWYRSTYTFTFSPEALQIEIPDFYDNKLDLQEKGYIDVILVNNIANGLGGGVDYFYTNEFLYREISDSTSESIELGRNIIRVPIPTDWMGDVNGKLSPYLMIGDYRVVQDEFEEISIEVIAHLENLRSLECNSDADCRSSQSCQEINYKGMDYNVCGSAELEEKIFNIPVSEVKNKTLLFIMVFPFSLVISTGTFLFKGKKKKGGLF